MPRPQFRLSTLLWLTLAVACWFGGREFQRREYERTPPNRNLLQVLHAIDWLNQTAPRARPGQK
jgi:hypothetical protein